MTAIQHFKYLLVGGGMAADQAAAGIRAVDAQGSIGILSADVDGPYARPALSKKLWVDENFHDEDIDFKTAEKQQAQLFLRTVVTQIDPAAHQVKTSTGQAFSYDKLLLATGAKARTLAGTASQRVVALRSKADYLKIRAFSGQQQTVIVVGDGFIGSEIAAGLAQSNTQVIYVIAGSQLFERKLPTALCQELEQKYTAAGVKFYYQEKAATYQLKGEQVELTLEDGTRLLGDGLVLGLGAEIDYQLAKQAGLHLDKNGVVVDQYLQTSAADIWAAGDIISYPDVILGQTKSEHVKHAIQSGYVAGKNMAGQAAAYTYTPYFYSWVFDISWEALGTLDTSLQLYQEKLTSGQLVYYFDDQGQLQGILSWNAAVDLDHLRNLFRQHPDLKTLQQVLPLKPIK
ncbi:MAG: FAD/NAD(P)-binding oxidoreductase [Liquorilactobacillus ghanensis]|uniref:NAD(P)/FAD-dependent oxidoreductase n=1 Tax=Liquorilactobacillus ghanensis TaxID=399370 RepID=UPI0039E9C012